MNMDVVAHDFQTLLTTTTARDYLLRNNGDQVKIDSLKGKILGFYFSAAWCGPCQRFTPCLIQLYNKLSSSNYNFEIVFISADEDDDSFHQYFSKMPWLAVPFSDFNTRDHLDDLFKVRGIPHLIFLDENGKLSTHTGVDIVLEFGVEGFPFTPDKIAHLINLDQTPKINQSLTSILVSHSRDFIISIPNRNHVPVAELQGKVVALYFSMFSYPPCIAFIPKLLDAYEKLKANGDSFEIVLIPLDDDDEEFFNQVSSNLPWFTLPFKDKSRDKLVRYFEISNLPTLVIIGQDGKTLHSNVAEAIEEHGIHAYPFTMEKFAELADLEKAKEEAQTLESVLVLGDNDFVIGKDRAKIPVSTLAGRNILFYFSADWCPPCRAFLPKLIEAYHKIKENNDSFEVIFISSDRDESSFDQIFSRMPWLALPFGDPRKASLSHTFKVQSIPVLVAIGSDGRTVTKDAIDIIRIHGAKAYPFTAGRVEELEIENEEIAKRGPEKVKHTLHEEHELVLSRRKVYICDGCDEEGRLWSYLCKECDFDLHPKCALENRQGNQEDGNEG